jgi:hypothetical protein
VSFMDWFHVGVPESRFCDGFCRSADFVLDFSCNLFDDAVGFKIRIVRQFACLFPYLALHFVDLASNLILSSPLKQIEFRITLRFIAELNRDLHLVFRKVHHFSCAFP